MNTKNPRKCPVCGKITYQDASTDTMQCVSKKCKWSQKIERRSENDGAKA